MRRRLRIVVAALAFCAFAGSASPAAAATRDEPKAGGYWFCLGIVPGLNKAVCFPTITL